MPLLHEDFSVHDNSWTFYDDETDLPDNRGKVIVNAQRYVQMVEQQEPLPSGVRLVPTDKTEVLALSLASLTLICIEFPAFTDGRGYSHARLLRKRFGYTGELRAVGDIRADQILFMKRLGISTFDCKELPDIAHLKQLITQFKHNYQPSYPLPQVV